MMSKANSRLSDGVTEDLAANTALDEADALIRDAINKALVILAQAWANRDKVDVKHLGLHLDGLREVSAEIDEHIRNRADYAREHQ